MRPQDRNVLISPDDSQITQLTKVTADFDKSNKNESFILHTKNSCKENKM